MTTRLTLEPSGITGGTDQCVLFESGWQRLEQSFFIQV